MDNYNTYVRNSDGTVSLLSLYRDYGWNGVGWGPRFDSTDQLEWYDGSIVSSKAYENGSAGFSVN